MAGSDALIDYSMYKYPIAELNILNDPSDAREYEYRKASSPRGPGRLVKSSRYSSLFRRMRFMIRSGDAWICGYNSASEQDRLVLEYRLLYHDMADPSFGIL